MLKYITAGESHGKAIIGILQGLPANLKVDINKINAELVLRQQGYGRGTRQQIECDRAEILAGIRGGVTTGAPIGFLVENKDFENWKDIIGVDATKLKERKVTAVRPGHADLAGCIKYNQQDARNILERASARSTVADVVVGSICLQFLSESGIKVEAEVVSVGGVAVGDAHLGVPNNIKKAIDLARAKGDTLGGVVKLRIKYLGYGFGSHIAPETRLEYHIMSSLGAIQSVKAVAIGDILQNLSATGSEFHDELFIDNNGQIIRKTSRAGGIEGGISNGEDIVVSVFCKPIPSVPMGLKSVDIATKKPSTSASERGDTSAIESVAVVAKSVLAFTISKVILSTLGGDHMDEIKERMKVKKEASFL
ncbi:MAG: chorismate synthase [Firmicutes bacterium]|nr:chorismate synthase [Bacillota bacterium]